MCLDPQRLITTLMANTTIVGEQHSLERVVSVRDQYCGCNSIGRVPSFQVGSCGFESRHPLQIHRGIDMILSLTMNSKEFRYMFWEKRTNPQGEEYDIPVMSGWISSSSHILALVNSHLGEFSVGVDALMHAASLHRMCIIDFRLKKVYFEIGKSGKENISEVLSFSDKESLKIALQYKPS